MSTRLVLPADRSWTQLTDGTNNAFITGVAGDAELFLGDATPDSSSAAHPMGNEIVIRTPLIAWVRASQPAAGRAEITYSVW